MLLEVSRGFKDVTVGGYRCFPSPMTNFILAEAAIASGWTSPKLGKRQGKRNEEQNAQRNRQPK